MTRMKHAAPWAMLASALVLVGCGSSDPDEDEPYDCATETRDDTFSIGMSHTGDGGFEVILDEASPAPPSRGDNTWQIRVLDDAGDPVSDLAVGVTPCMVDHGHGTPITPETTTGAAAGELAVSPINLWMPGLWRVSVVLFEGDAVALDCATGLPESQADVVDTIEFAFCIDG